MPIFIRSTDQLTESDLSTQFHGGYLLDEFGYELCGACSAVGLDVAVADGLAGQLGNMRRDEIRVSRGVFHALPSAIAVKPVAHVEVLLEVVPEREVHERALGGG